MKRLLLLCVLALAGCSTETILAPGVPDYAIYNECDGAGPGMVTWRDSVVSATAVHAVVLPPASGTSSCGALEEQAVVVACSYQGRFVTPDSISGFLLAHGPLPKGMTVTSSFSAGRDGRRWRFVSAALVNDVPCRSAASYIETVLCRVPGGAQ